MLMLRVAAREHGTRGSQFDLMRIRYLEPNFHYDSRLPFAREDRTRPTDNELALTSETHPSTREIFGVTSRRPASSLATWAKPLKTLFVPTIRYKSMGPAE